MMNKKSQVGVEFLILIGFVLFSFIVFFGVIQENTYDKNKQKQNVLAGNVVLSVQDEINLALKSREGYYREFKLPEDINGVSYEINIIGEMVYLNTSNKKIAIALPVSPVTGQIAKGTNIIQKKEGIIYLNP